MNNSPMLYKDPLSDEELTKYSVLIHRIADVIATTDDAVHCMYCLADLQAVSAAMQCNQTLAALYSERYDLYSSYNIDA